MTLTRPGLLPAPCSITLLTSLNTGDNMCCWTTRYGSNCQADFVNSVAQMIDAGALLPGDILVMDNASVHTGSELQYEFRRLLSDNGIELAHLPTYSPELNPCEFVFSRIKHFIRSPQALMFDELRGQQVAGNFDDLITASTGLISRESLEETYRHCRTLVQDSHIAKKLVENGLIVLPD